MSKKVEQLPAQSSPSGSALIVISEGGTSKKSTIDEITAASEAAVAAALQPQINAKVTANVAITPGTKTKITYDSKGLITGATNATTADIPDSTDKRYVTDAQRTLIDEQAALFDDDGNLVIPTDGAGIILKTPSGDDYLHKLTDEGALVDMSGFVSVANGDFILKGKPYKGIGFNYYPLAWSGKSTITEIMDYILSVGGNEIRFWLFDQLTPSDSAGNFHFLDYPLGTNLISNPGFETGSLTNWTATGDFTSSTERSHGGTKALKQISAGGYNGCYSDTITVTASTNYTLTLWYYIESRAGFGSLVTINDAGNTVNLVNGGLLEGPIGQWNRHQINFNSGANTSIRVNVQNFSGFITMFYDDFTLNVQGSPIISPRESQFLILDFVFDEAAKRGLKLIPVFADNTTNYNTKKTYVDWANNVYGAGITSAFPYIGFFANNFAIQIFKDNIADVLTRRNTINGKLYSQDPVVKEWELGNELRADRDDPSGVNTVNSANIALICGEGGWADQVSTYMVETLGAKQCITFGSMAHEYEYRLGDVIYNGSYYGVSAKVLAQRKYIHSLDFHLYPTQDAQSSELYGLGELDILSYGQKVANKPAPIKQSGTSVTSKVVVLNAATIAGDIIVPHIVFSGTPGSTPVVTDNGGNTYTLTSNDSTTYHYTSTHTTPATQLTVTWTTSRNVTVYIDERSGRENANNARSREGLEAQLLDWINIGKAAGKPATIMEHGYSVDLNNRYNYHYPLQPRIGAFDALFQFWFENGGAQIDLWSAGVTEGTSYTVNLGDRDGAAITDNSDDTNLNARIKYYNDWLRHDLARSEQDIDKRYVQSERVARSFDGDYEGVTQWGVSGEALAFGNLVYLDEFTTRWKKAGANLTIGRDRKLGMVVHGVGGAGESIRVLTMGMIRADSLFPTFTVGRPVFMSETVGLVSSSKPTTTGAVHRVIGFADSADQLSFQPDGHFSYVS